MLWQTLTPWTFYMFLLIDKGKSSTRFLFHKIWADSTLLDSAQQFSKVAVQRYTPTTVYNQLFHIWSIVQHLVLSDLKIFDSITWLYVVNKEQSNLHKSNPPEFC